MGGVPEMADKIRTKTSRKKTGDVRRPGESRPRPATRGSMDIPFLILVLVLMGIGLLMLFSASFATAYYENLSSTYYFTRQGIFALAGLFIMFIISFMDYRRFRALSPLLLAVSIGLLILVLLIGTGNYGEKRWINLGFFQFQPSEIAKVAVIFFFSSIISLRAEKMHTFKYGVLPFVIVLAVIGGLMFLEPHLS